MLRICMQEADITLEYACINLYQLHTYSWSTVNMASYARLKQLEAEGFEETRKIDTLAELPTEELHHIFNALHAPSIRDELWIAAIENELRTRGELPQH